MNRRALASSVAFLALETSLAFKAAAVVTWNGGGVGGDWSDAANWDGGTVPANTGILIDSNNNTGAHHLNQNFTLQDLTFNSAALNTLRANSSGTTARTLTLAGTTPTIQLGSNAPSAFDLGGTASSTGALTLQLDSNTTLDVDDNTRVDLRAIVSGTGSFEKTGIGTLHIYSGNTFSGGFIWDRGRVMPRVDSVKVGSSITSGPFGTGAVTVTASQWTMELPSTGADRTIHNAFSVAGNGTLNCSIPLVLAGNISGPSDAVLRKSNSETLTLTGSNSGFTGTLVFDAGTIRIGTNTALGSGTFNTQVSGVASLLSDSSTERTLANSIMAIHSGTIIVGGSDIANKVKFTGAVNLANGMRRFDVRTTFTLTNTVSNGGLIKEGTGILALTGTNSFNGEVQINRGTVDLSNSKGLGLDPNGNFTTTKMEEAGHTLIFEREVEGPILSKETFSIKGTGSAGPDPDPAKPAGVLIIQSGDTSRHGVELGQVKIKGNTSIAVRNKADLKINALTRPAGSTDYLVSFNGPGGYTTALGGQKIYRSTCLISAITPSPGGTGTLKVHTNGPRLTAPPGTTSISTLGDMVDLDDPDMDPDLFGLPHLGFGKPSDWDEYDAEATGIPVIAVGGTGNFAASIDTGTSDVLGELDTDEYTGTVVGPIYGSGTLFKVGDGTLASQHVRIGTLSVDQGAVRITQDGGNDGASKIGTLIFATNGGNPTTTFDLNDNDLILNHDTYSNVRDKIAYARNDGAWNQPGITSDAAKNNSSHITTLGVMTGSQYQSINGGTATFNGMSVASNDVLVKYTYYGDTDLSGNIDFDDYVRIDEGYNNSGADWFHGDCDLNGVVDFDDYTLIDMAYNGQGATYLGNPLWDIGESWHVLALDDYLPYLISDFAKHLIYLVESDFYPPGLGQGWSGGVLPEPTGIGVVLLGAPFALRRRRK